MSDYGDEMGTCGHPDVEMDPNATKDFTFSWAGFLNGDTIDSVAYTMPDGGTVASSSNTDSTSTAFVTAIPCGRVVRLIGRIVTTGGRTEDKTLRIKGAEQ